MQKTFVIFQFLKRLIKKEILINIKKNWYLFELVSIERISNKKKKNNKTLIKLNKSKIINIQNLFFRENFSNFPVY